MAHLLLLQDDGLTAESLRTALTASGHQIEAVTTAEERLEVLGTASDATGSRAEPSRRTLILSVRGRGYRLDAP